MYTRTPRSRWCKIHLACDHTYCCLAAGECCQNYPVDNSSMGDCGDLLCR